jgi:hypothetical protein
MNALEKSACLADGTLGDKSDATLVLNCLQLLTGSEAKRLAYRNWNHNLELG